MSGAFGDGDMPVYKLEPIEGTEEHTDWWASSVPPTPVWLRAGNANHARQRMHLATYATAFVPGGVLSGPWVDATLVRCTEDQSRDVPPDKALLANGQISLKLS
jgi:hypothetical protein